MPGLSPPTGGVSGGGRQTPKLMFESADARDNVTSRCSTFINEQTADIAAAKCVQIDFTKTTYGIGASVKLSDHTQTKQPGIAACVGITREILPKGGYGEVITYGVVKGVPCDAGVAQGDALVPSTAVDGNVMTAAAAGDPQLGVALIARTAGGLVDIFVKGCS